MVWRVGIGYHLALAGPADLRFGRHGATRANDPQQRGKRGDEVHLHATAKANVSVATCVAASCNDAVQTITDRGGNFGINRHTSTLDTPHSCDTLHSVPRRAQRLVEVIIVDLVGHLGQIPAPAAAVTLMPTDGDSDRAQQ